jgi:hypothetical protein
VVDYAKGLKTTKPSGTDPEASAAGVFLDTHPSGSVRAYKPTWRDELALLVGKIMPEQTTEGLMGSRGIGSTGMGLVDFTPAGIPLAADEAKRAAESGNYGEAALDLAGMAPIPGAKGGKKAVKAAAEVFDPEARIAARGKGGSMGEILADRESFANAPEAVDEPAPYLPNRQPMERPKKTGYAAGLEFGALPASPKGALPVYLSPDARRVVEARAGQMAIKDPKKRVQPDPNAVGLDLSEENYRRTYTDAPQDSLEGQIPYPTDEQAATMPLGGRAQGLMDPKRLGKISTRMAKDIRASGEMGKDTQHFYGLYPLKQFLVEHGVEPDEAQRQIETFGKYYAATSPRTSTENNLRHASLLSALEKANPGIDLTEFRRGGLPAAGKGEKQATFLPTGANQMMDMHTNLANMLREGGDLDLNVNTKPALFARGSAGNVSDPVADTHNIRSIIHIWNEIEPGGVHPSWLTKEARARYAADPSSLNVATDVEDKLTGHTVNKQYRQTEYGVVADVTRHVAKKLNVSPGEAQALMWFVYGNKTGLDSAPKSIVQLIQERASVTGKLIGMDPKEVVLRVMRRELPLATVLGGAVGAGAAAGGGNGDYAAGLKQPDKEVY